MTLHNKKINTKYYDAVLNGAKPFEIRKEDDCTYAVGDTIELVEIHEPSMHRRVRGMEVVVTYKLTHEDFPDGIQPGYCVLGIRPTQ